MARCAVFNSQARSWEENSSSLRAEVWEWASGGGSIAFSAPAEDEGAAAAFHHPAIDPGPESDKIIQRGNQRQKDHEPDGDECDPVNREDERANRPAFPAMVEYDRDHGNDLNQHLEFSQIAGFNGKAFRSSDGTQAADQKLAADDYHGHPGGDERWIELDQGDESGRNQQFVGQGVEQNTHGGDLAALAGEIAINAVSDGGGDEESGSQQFFSAVGRLKATGREYPYQQGNAKDASQRDGIGQIHCGLRHIPG